MEIISYLFDWIYPARCLICRTVLPLHHKENICSNCRTTMPFIHPPICKKCGRPEEDELCSHCLEAVFAFKKGIAAFPYQVMRETIFHFKYEGFSKDGIGLGKLMSEYLQTFYPEEITWTDIMLPVPISPKKRRQRGFNQAEILAQELAKYIKKPCLTDVLIRKKHTKPQNTLTLSERKKNIQEAFSVNKPDSISGKNILIIDDIFTTGSTINECARELLKMGAAEVRFYTLSIT